MFGIYGHAEAAKLTYLGLHALQHRGQEGAGIASTDDNGHIRHHLGRGLVADVFGEKALTQLGGNTAIGHVRYSTTGGNSLSNVQPITVRTGHGELTVAHNGNLVNASHLRTSLEREGAIFMSDNDTEVIVHLLAREKGKTIEERLQAVLQRIEGAYSLVIMHENRIFGIRDPHGYRPLVIGKIRDAHVLASETCALELIEGDFIREVEPGEIVVLDQDGLHSKSILAPDTKQQACIFELVYFARPNTQIFQSGVYNARTQMGRTLAREAPVEADVVVPVPDSGVPAATGYAEESGLPFRHGLLRSHYVGRTFIEPEQSIRHFGVKLKLSPVRSLLEGKRVVVVDDSIVRGTTSRKIVGMLKGAGAKEVHVRISSPPNTHSCFYGIDTPTRGELIAAQQDLESIRSYLTADSLAYLSVKGLHASVGDTSGRFCNACFTGEYVSGRELIQIGVTPPEPNLRASHRAASS